MTVSSLPAPPEPMQQLGVNLTTRQVEELDTLAAKAGLKRSQLLRWVIDLALPTVREAVARRTLIPPTPDS